MATAFGGGMGRQGNTCGALTGALMAVGLAMGRRDANGSRDPAYAAATEIQRRFLEAFGCMDCRDLTGCDFTKPDGHAKFVAEKKDLDCARFLGLTAAAVVELVEQG